MRSINSIMAAALANTGEAELDCYEEYMNSAEGEDVVRRIRADCEALADKCRGLEWLAEAERCAVGIIGTIEDRLAHAECLVNHLIEIRDGYVDRLGIPSAMQEAASGLCTKKDDQLEDSLRYGLELTSASERALSRDLYRSLRALGMPVTHAGGLIKTYRDAYYSNPAAWMKPGQCVSHPQ